MLQILKQIEDKFWIIYKVARRWAINNLIFGEIFGLLNENIILILVYKIIEENKKENSILILIEKMFSELIEINNENNKIIKIEEEINENVEDWNLDLDIERRKFELENNGFTGLKSSEKTKIVWKIINLGYPPQNVAFKINYYTQIIIKEKMEIAIKQLNKIEKLENENEIKRELNKWIKGKDFVEMYQHYLLVICAYSPDSLGGPSLCDLIECHLTFLLIKKFETLKFIEYFHINPKALFKRGNCPKATGIKEEDWKCTGWIIGFKILKEEETKENIEELKNKIKSLKENDFKKYIDKNGEEGKIKIGASYLNEKKFKEFIAA